MNPTNKQVTCGLQIPSNPLSWN